MRRQVKKADKGMHQVIEMAVLVMKKRLTGGAKTIHKSKQQQTSPPGLRERKQPG